VVGEYVALEVTRFIPAALILSKNYQFLTKCTIPFVSVIMSRLVLMCF
jgi:hypothetical protein